jgi:hypothetical protein
MTGESHYDMILELRLTQPSEADEVIRFGIKTANRLDEEDQDEFHRIRTDSSLAAWVKQSFYRDKWTLLPKKR